VKNAHYTCKAYKQKFSNNFTEDGTQNGYQGFTVTNGTTSRTLVSMEAFVNKIIKKVPASSSKNYEEMLSSLYDPVIIT
jgi:hypothetical protein